MFLAGFEPTIPAS